jgi:hypothetical protein
LVFGDDTRGFLSDGGVETYAVDAEITRNFCCSDGWDFDVAFGFRYASLEDLAHVSLTGTDGRILPTIALADATSITEFYGPGITAAFGGDKAIYRSCCSQLKLFWTVRGSIVWGDITSSTQTAVTVVDPFPTGYADRVDFALARTEDEMLIGELQVGLQWEHQLRCTPAAAFARIAFEYQYWDADGGWAETQSLASVNATSAIASASAGPDIELEMIGFTLGAGLTW